jgi:SynChlorMet cassette protein ScmC
MTRILRQGVQHNLALADESLWVIAAVDEKAASIVSQLGDAMRLRVISPSASHPHHGAVHRLLVKVDANDTESSRPPVYTLLPTKGEDLFISVLLPFDHSDGLYIQLVRLSLIFAREAQASGGVLIHGALVERDGIGVILAAPGGTGKTTASNRLPAPWSPLCDDTTLVVRDPQGNYWAHPWPTWSRFLDGGPGGTWDVQRAVPLKRIFFLSRALEDRVEPVGAGQAVSLLVECAKQASELMVEGLGKEETRSLHLERFNNLCALSRVVRAHLLHVSLTGAFWHEIEQALEDNDIR